MLMFDFGWSFSCLLLKPTCIHYDAGFKWNEIFEIEPDTYCYCMLLCYKS